MRILLIAPPSLTVKQHRFVEDYYVDGNGSQVVLRAGYQAKYLAEIAYELLRSTKASTPFRILRTSVARGCKCG
jgi:hypothetical protein